MKTKFTLPKAYIEVSKICCRKPDVSMTKKGKDSRMRQRLELYAMLMYARSLVKPGKDVNICASYYYLRKNSDNSVTKEFHPNFFEGKGAGNIVTLWEEYTPDRETEWDLEFKPQFEDFYFGEEICGDGCDGCDFSNAAIIQCQLYNWMIRSMHRFRSTRSNSLTRSGK